MGAKLERGDQKIFSQLVHFSSYILEVFYETGKFQ